MKQSNNTSLGKGSVILIKGAPDSDGRKKLYAAHIDGFAQFNPGATMLFLSSDFYRIKKIDGQLRAVRTDYRNEDTLRSMLNLKTPGRISIVKNNNKTPYHWLTTKHLNVSSALKEIEGSLLGDNDLMESEYNGFENPHEPKDIEWTPFYNKLLDDCLSTIFYSSKKVEVYSYDITEHFDSEIEESESSSIDINWEISFEILFSNKPELDELFKYWEMSRMLELTIIFDSEVEVTRWNDPGDRENPPDSLYEIEGVNTHISEIFINGSDGTFTDENQELINKIKEIIKGFDPSDLDSYIKKNIKKPFYLD